MKAHQLAGYGKSLVEMMATTPPELLQENAQVGWKILARHMDKDQVASFPRMLSIEKDKLPSLQVFANPASRFLSPEFVEQQMEWAATFKALHSLFGKEGALQVLTEVAGSTYPRVFRVMFPKPGDLKRFENPFNAFRGWFLAMMEANRRIGVLIHEVVEDGRDAFQVNCVKCAWHDTQTQLGVPDACIPICRSDDAFFPQYARRIGMRFRRTATLAQGGKVCDYRFERGTEERKD